MAKRAYYFYAKINSKKRIYYQTATRKTDSWNHKPPHIAIYLLFKITSKNSIMTVIDLNAIPMLCVNTSIFSFMIYIQTFIWFIFKKYKLYRIWTKESTYHEYPELCFVFGIATDLYVGDIPLTPRTISSPQNWTSMAWYGVFWTTRHHHPSLLDLAMPDTLSDLRTISQHFSPFAWLNCAHLESWQESWCRADQGVTNTYAIPFTFLWQSIETPQK